MNDENEPRARRRLSVESAIIIALSMADFSWVALSVHARPSLHLQTEAGLLLIAVLVLAAVQAHLSFAGYLLAVAPSIAAMLFIPLAGMGVVDPTLASCVCLFVVGILITTWRQQTSDRKLAELRGQLIKKNTVLGESIRLNELAEETTMVGYWRVETATQSLTWSSKIFGIHGLDPRTYQPSVEDALRHYHPDDRALISGCLEAAMASGRSYECQARIIQQDGSIRHVVTRGACDLSKAGTVTAVFGTFMDVTDLKLADAALRESEARLRMLTENAADIIVRSDLHGRALYFSPAVEAVTGLRPDEVVGLFAHEYVHSDDLPLLTRSFQGLLESRGEKRQTLEIRVRRKDGGWAWVESNAWLGFDPHSGQALEFCDIVRDITARKALDEDLARATEAATAAVVAKSEFLANMSHEIRTPLTSIIGFSSILAQRNDLMPDVLTYLKRVEDSARALLAIVNDVLDFSKLDAGQLEVERQALDLRGLIAEIVESSEPHLAQKNLTISVTDDGDLPTYIITDPTRVRQILVNLINNAVKFTSIGGVVVRILYRVDDEVPVVRIEVEDTGVGIPPHKRTRLFKRFAQADNSISRAYGGTGLGLAICKKLVALLGGDIGVESTEGQGSTFWFETPAPTGELEAPNGSAATCDEAVDLTGKRILVVDDVAANRELVKVMLAPFDPVIVEAASGEDALILLESQIFNLILMDVQMPGMSGLEAAQRIRTGATPCACPIIAMTANHLPEQIKACFEAGMSAHVAKPFVPADLMTAIFYWVTEDINITEADFNRRIA